MKKYFLLLLLITTYSFSFGQNMNEMEVLGNSRKLHQTVFGNKDATVLEELFAKGLTYGHSSGKIQNRAEAIEGIKTNKSTYTDTSLKSYDVNMNGDVAVVRYTMRETETNGEGKASPLKLSIMLVWVKEKGKWKLFGRQAVKLPE